MAVRRARARGGAATRRSIRPPPPPRAPVSPHRSRRTHYVTSAVPSPRAAPGPTIRRGRSAMIEADLVREVQKHPVLYDRSVSGFNKTRMRDDAWREVQRELKVPEFECKKRWRSMRDSFIKLQRTRGGRAGWPYLELMKFLLPHIEVKNQNHQTDESEDDDFKDQELPFQPEITMTVHDSPIHLSDLNGEIDEDPSDRSETCCAPDASEMCYMKRSLKPGDENFLSCTSCHQTADPDELFLLSFAPNLKRMDPRQNAVARMRIQQVLFEVEFGASINRDYMGRPIMISENIVKNEISKQSEFC